MSEIQQKDCAICDVRMVAHPACAGRGCGECDEGLVCPGCNPVAGIGWSTKTARVGFAEHKAELTTVVAGAKWGAAVRAKSGKINRDCVVEGWHLGLELGTDGVLRGAAESEAKGVFVKLPPQWVREAAKSLTAACGCGREDSMLVAGKCRECVK